MDQMTRAFLRVLKKVERLEKDRANRIRKFEEHKRNLHTKYVAYQAEKNEEPIQGSYPP